MATDATSTILISWNAHRMKTKRCQCLRWFQFARRMLANCMNKNNEERRNMKRMKREQKWSVYKKKSGKGRRRQRDVPRKRPKSKRRKLQLRF